MCPQGPLKANTSTLTHRDEFPSGAGCPELRSASTLVCIKVNFCSIRFRQYLKFIDDCDTLASSPFVDAIFNVFIITTI